MLVISAKHDITHLEENGRVMTEGNGELRCVKRQAESWRRGREMCEETGRVMAERKGDV